MDSNRLRQLISSYGGNPDRWPAEERQAALHLLGQSPELQDLQRSEFDLDGALDGWETGEPSNDLFDAVLPPTPVQTPVIRPAQPDFLEELWSSIVGWISRPVAATALATVIATSGFFTGYAVPQQTTDILQLSEVSEMILPTSTLLDSE